MAKKARPQATEEPIVIGVEITTRRRYAVHARTDEDAEELIRSLLSDENPTVVTRMVGPGSASAVALDRSRHSSERVAIDVAGADPKERKS